jgi:hypothetical protein
MILRPSGKNKFRAAKETARMFAAPCLSEVKYPRLREFTKKAFLDRLTLISVEDYKSWEEAGALIEKYVEPRLKAK